MLTSPQNNTGAPMKRRSFSAEFKRESAQLVLDQNYTVADAASAMDVGLSTMTRWVCKHTCISSRHFLRFPVFQPSTGILQASGYSGIHEVARGYIPSASDL